MYVNVVKTNGDAFLPSAKIGDWLSQENSRMLKTQNTWSAVNANLAELSATVDKTVEICKRKVVSSASILQMTAEMCETKAYLPREVD